jgi:nitrogen regulatory protein PII
MSEKENLPYEESHKLSRLGLVMAIVNDGQAASIVSILNNAGSSASFISYGKGTAKNDLYDVLGFAEEKKQCILSILTEDSWAKAKGELNKRFEVSSYSKGIAFYSYLTSVANVSTYRYLGNVRNEVAKGKGEKSMGEETMKKEGYEVLFVIVNDGFTDLVIDASRKAGARGGTVLTARGTGNKEMEKFFGVVITPEKQIVLILVKKEIKDKVLSAISHDVNISAKGQGIAFSIAANDVVGIAPEETEMENEEKAVSSSLPKEDNNNK